MKNQPPSNIVQKKKNVTSSKLTDSNAMRSSHASSFVVDGYLVSSPPLFTNHPTGSMLRLFCDLQMDATASTVSPIHRDETANNYSRSSSLHTIWFPFSSSIYHNLVMFFVVFFLLSMLVRKERGSYSHLRTLIHNNKDIKCYQASGPLKIHFVKRRF
mmetsp:Transcript_44733/g.108475  ORF Transcript_44733/g.108475 Transcript_44733/m.108475 type:complete len:158 (-) Transcript_44733:2554-3027(-)